MVKKVDTNPTHINVFIIESTHVGCHMMYSIQRVLWRIAHDVFITEIALVDVITESTLLQRIFFWMSHDVCITKSTLVYVT